MQLYNSSADKAGAGSAFVAEMHPIVEAFHRCQCATTPTGSGCCRGSGARSPGSTTAFGDHATVANHSAAISCDDRHSFGSCGTYDFWSIDINAYLYREKLVLARMASLLGNNTGAAHWTADASQLLPRLRDMFYVQDDGDSARGFFHDRCFNQTVVRRLHGAVLRGGDPGPGGRHDQSAVGPEPVPAHLLAAVLVPGQRALISGRVLARPRLARPGLVRHRGAQALRVPRSGERHQVPGVHGHRGHAAQRHRAVPRVLLYDPENGTALGAAHFSWSAAHILPPIYLSTCTLDLDRVRPGTGLVRIVSVTG